MQLNIEYSRITNQLCTAIRLTQFKHFSDECQLPSYNIKLSVKSVHQLQQWDVLLNIYIFCAVPIGYDFEQRSPTWNM